MAENQTGIYPQSSPGGWQIIGNCPLSFFDSDKNPPVLFKPGDRLKFYEISLEEHQAIAHKVNKGTYTIKSFNDEY